MKVLNLNILANLQCKKGSLIESSTVQCWICVDVRDIVFFARDRYLQQNELQIFQNNCLYLQISPIFYNLIHKSRNSRTRSSNLVILRT